MKVIVIGAGAWGTALAVKAARPPVSHKVELWVRDASRAQVMADARENVRYLPGIPLPHGLQVVHADEAAYARINQASLVIVATAMAGLRPTLEKLRECRAPVAWLCKGFEAPQEQPGGLPRRFGLMPHEVCQQVAPDLLAGVLTGPSFAQEVARGQPTAVVAASRHESVRHALVDALHGGSMRVYANDDVVGAEVGGAVKNVLAIAAGLCDGLTLGLNARAALITRGLAEITRLGYALGARPETFMGLSGVGDLVLTCTGDLSRNRQIGLMLADGKSLPEAVASLGHVAEGVYSCRTVVQRARYLGVEMPIAECVLALLDGELKPVEAVAALMGREPKGELL